MARESPEPQTTREYVLGTNPVELQRLGFQHRLWSRHAHRLWMQAGIAPGQSVLDVGCGPGFASMDFAQIVGPTGQVVGIDESEPYIAFANDQARHRQLSQARFFVADAAQLHTLDGLAGLSFDIAYVRWVLCFVPDPAAVVRAISRHLKPGGRLLVQDYFRYETMCVAPRSDAFERVIAAIAKSWRDRGGDPDIMARLPGIAIEAGLSPEHIDRVEPGPARPGSTMWNWPDTFWKAFLPRLEELGYITPDLHRDFLSTWEAISHNPAAFMHLPPMYEMMARKRS
ncbi:MAG TPA: methyltransferase domain-containing protein [Phycisphaerales bacterium]|nr:methyltransferase domain-containing protein [Phycisphaerales bacterium]